MCRTVCGSRSWQDACVIGVVMRVSTKERITMPLASLCHSSTEPMLLLNPTSLTLLRSYRCVCSHYGYASRLRHLSRSGVKGKVVKNGSFKVGKMNQCNAYLSTDTMCRISCVHPTPNSISCISCVHVRFIAPRSPLVRCSIALW